MQPIRFIKYDKTGYLIMTAFIYLHGFASGPGSKKATEFAKAFSEVSSRLFIPDLEGGDFQGLSLSRQIDTISACMDNSPEKQFGLIGSSMGGYLAMIMAQLRQEVQAVYLMAPGFYFLKRWRSRMHGEKSASEGIPDLIHVFHYRYNKYMPLSTGLFCDAEKWDQIPLDRKLPTRIVHGIHDDTVSIVESRNFVAAHPWCQLQELDSDHQLLSHIDWIVEDCLEFFSKEEML